MQVLRRISASVVGPSSLALSTLLIWIALSMGVSAHAQTSAAQPEYGSEALSPAAAVIPQQVRYAGKLANRTGQTVDVIFRIYAVQQDGEPLWTETQRLTVGEDGSYSVLLGSADPRGLPQAVFAGGAARWLGVSVEGAPESDRVLLASVPYAMKSADAEALAGHAATDFVTQAQLSQLEAQRAQAPAAAPAFTSGNSGTVTGGGTAGTIPMWTGTQTQGNSDMVQVGNDIGIHEATPAATLDVGGTGMIRGLLTLPAVGTATTSAGADSQILQFDASAWSTTASGAVTPTFRMYANPTSNDTANPGASFRFQYQLGATTTTVLSFGSNGALITNGGLTMTPVAAATSAAGVNSPALELGASAYSSGSSSAVAQNFVWQVLPIGNDTATPSGDLALLYASGTHTPAATGLSISPTGLINWASGQTFPITGTGGGTITGVTAGTDLTGGGTSNTVTLNVDTTKVVTGVTPGTGLTGGGTGGTPTLTVDSSIVPLLSANNVFTAGQSFENGISVTGVVSTAAVFNGGGNGTQGQAGVVSAGGSTAISGVQYGGAGLNGSGGAGAGSFGNQGGGDGIDAYGGTSTASSSVAGSGGYFSGGGVGPGIYGGDGVYSFGGTGEQGGYGISAFGGNAVNGCGNLCTAGAGGVFNGGGGSATNGGDGILAYAGDQGGTGIVGVACSGYSDATNCTEAALFLGDVDVVGNVSKSGGSFKIDHPLDPANKYLYHSFVESPDMKNIYDGTIVTDGEGLATVTLPDWFEALNSDFRYQLTVIGQFAQAIVSSEISNNTFVIQTDKPNVKVSWQVTGIRQDAWAKAHRIPVEADKARADQGHYLHPELFGHAGESSIAALHHPRPAKRVGNQVAIRTAAAKAR